MENQELSPNSESINKTIEAYSLACVLKQKI